MSLRQVSLINCHLSKRLAVAIRGQMNKIELSSIIIFGYQFSLRDFGNYILSYNNLIPLVVPLCQI